LLALSTPTTITVSVVGLIGFIALLALARVALRNNDPPAKTRVGFFIERESRDDPHSDARTHPGTQQP